MINLTELEKLADEATPGPWVWQGRRAGRDTKLFSDHGPSQSPVFICMMETMGANKVRSNRVRNMSYLSAANPETIKTLITALREAVGALEFVNDGSEGEGVMSKVSHSLTTIRKKVEGV